jgi:threonine dehydrogenase-like Zn-dependent dehydrogenase
VVAKGWEQVTRIRERSWHAGKVVLITGAGPIGLLAALIAVQEGYETHVVDVATTGPKPGLVRDLGASYSSDGVEPLQIVPDIVIECTGIGNVVFSCMRKLGPDGVVCLTGLSAAHETESVDGDAWNEQMVLRNAVVFGTVNAARRHYEQGAEALAKADRDWLARLVTRTVPVDHWTDALHHQLDDVKVTVDLTS